MTRLTKEQAIIIMGYTGIATISFSEFHRDVEQRLGRPVFTHEFGSQAMADQLKELYHKDFVSLCYAAV